MENNITDPRELEMQFNYLTNQIEEAKRQLTETRVALQEMQETLFAIAELETKPNTITSLGGTAFVRSKIETKEVIVPIGANVLAAKSPSEARKVIEERATKLAETVGKIESALGQMLQARQAIIQRAQSPQQLKNL